LVSLFSGKLKILITRLKYQAKLIKTPLGEHIALPRLPSWINWGFRRKVVKGGLGGEKNGGEIVQF